MAVMTAAGRPTRAFVILNPVHRRASAVRAELARQAAASGVHLVELQTTRADPGTDQARLALASGAELVVVCGGDGTVRLVAGELAGTGVPLGIVPNGTANLFARNLELRPGRLTACVATALGGPTSRVDLAWARLRSASGWSDERPFAVVAGLGHDAATVLATSARIKRRVAWLAYFAAGARRLLDAPLNLTVGVDGGPPEPTSAWTVLVANCGRLPGGIRVAADARPDDGELDTLQVTLRSPLDWAWVAAKGVLGWRRDVPALRYGRASRVRVASAVPLACQLDGDAVDGIYELDVRVDPGALLVQAPQKKGRP